MQKARTPSLWTKGLNWIANHTYRQIPQMIATYSIKNAQPKSLSFEDYVRQPGLAREAGLMCVRKGRLDKRIEGIQKVIGQFRQRPNANTQKPHQFQCPICLQIMNGPVTTSCAHTFCHMCLDEAVLFSPTCPVCRSQIRGEEFVISKSIERLISMFLLKLEMEEIQKFVKKEVDYGEWLRRREVKREEVDVGDCIDVRDTEFIWCRATVKGIFPANCESKRDRQAILVHYEGWANVFNEMIPLDSLRLASYKFYTSRVQIPHYNLSADNAQHLRSPVITGEYIPPPADFFDSNSSMSNDDIESRISIDHPRLRLRPFAHDMDQSDLEQLGYEHENINLRMGDEALQGVQLRQENSRGHRHEGRNFGGNASDRLNDFLGRFLQQYDSRLRSQQQIDGHPLSQLNRSLQAESFQNYRPNLNQSSDNVFNRPRRDYSQVYLYSENHRQQTLRQNPDENQSFYSGFNVANHNFVDSLELYSRNDPNLRNRLGQHQAIRRQSTRILSNSSISLRASSSSDLMIQTDSSLENNNIEIQVPNYSFGRVDSFQSLPDIIQKQLDYQTKRHDYHENFRQPFTSPDDHQMSFVVDIEEIQSSQNQIAHEIKQREQDKMELDKEQIQKARKQDLRKWNQLNQMIENYYNQEAENPQGQMGELKDFGEHLENGYLKRFKLIRNDLEDSSLQQVLEQIVENDAQCQQVIQVYTNKQTSEQV